MRLLGNVLWLLLAGLWMALGYVLAGVLLCVTVVGIPFGVQSFKLAGYALWPFGRVVVDRRNAGPAVSGVANVLWILLAGIWLALGHVVTGALLCLTVIGIPFGVASFKMAGLALAPFGREVVSASRVGSQELVVSSVAARG